jgi:hypothetical protein
VKAGAQMRGCRQGDFTDNSNVSGLFGYALFFPSRSFYCQAWCSYSQLCEMVESPERVTELVGVTMRGCRCLKFFS